MVSGRAIVITVRVTYLPGKAAIFYPGGLDNALKFLLADLTSLSLPHPEASNVLILSTGVLDLYWETTERSILHHTLVGKIASPSKDWLQILTGQLIQKMVYKEELDKTLKDIIFTQLNSTNCNHVSLKRRGRPSLSASSAKVAEFSPSSEPTAQPSSVSVYPQNLSSTEDATSQRLTESAVEMEPGLEAPLSHDGANLLPLSQCSPKADLSANDAPSHAEEMLPSHTGICVSRPDSVSTPPPAKRVYREQEITQLMQELEHLNREVTSLAAKRAEIRERLKDAGATDIPLCDSSVEDFACRIRLRALEVEIEIERQKRIEYELVLEDIRRECKFPFIVPSLLDAFVEVSKLTNAAVKH
ncbi:uncharacterized protein BT62DRAFT_923820 [Guyanagaster necrorhizus]|uniref:Uncharacterized protein n=1 Tax=Guyanagaster necrorhizus TaxID=856835 RepID=A0A9P7VHR8_9AGAR|nr:uncharacterized protein BT62DRAFT_923820 [Guyanagaster necrorhizus MCA 3950]KAG7440785.1 hypothetical protein BT62DRAFT_923820 [Guyanagaster necrorhizus MCA 3950]